MYNVWQLPPLSSSKTLAALQRKTYSLNIFSPSSLSSALGNLQVSLNSPVLNIT
jgi:hypothetical protein